MSARSKARKRALDILFSADVRAVSAQEVLAGEAQRALSEPSRSASWEYARDIVVGVLENQQEIDELIATYSRGWTLERMPAVDRAALRIAIWEILFNPEVPVGVAISEAVELVQELSTDESSSFVNGLLSSVSAGRT